MKCLVTGSAGFIGNALVSRLASEGHQVIALVHKNKPKKRVKNVEYIAADITDKNLLLPVINDVDVIFHCAAYVKDYGSWNIFYKINFEGTKNLVEISKKIGVKKFIFLSHIKYESDTKFGYYSKSKMMAEEYLIKEYKKNNFPFIILRPGNVYGPGATTWVLRNLNSIKKNKIALIDQGNGIFIHTYIDNLLDALVAAMQKPDAIGKSFNITDGDNNTTFCSYFNMLAKMAGKSSIKRNMSKKTAMLLGKIMLLLNKIFRIKPWVTPFAVEILTNKNPVDIKKAKEILEYVPKVDFNQGMKNVEKWLKEEGHI